MANRIVPLSDSEEATLLRATQEFNASTGNDILPIAFLIMLVRHRLRGFAAQHQRADKADDASALARALASPDAPTITAILDRYRASLR